MDFVQPGKHESFPLPFDYNALEPVISAETLRLHHDILHKSSIDSLNITERELSEAIKGTDYDIINHLRNELSYYSSDVILYSIYWTTLAPAGQGGQPGIDTASQIARCFGSFPSFREQFTSMADRVELTGWSILFWQPAWHRLEILQTGKDEIQTPCNGIPILALDMWEHAYFLDYKTAKAEYIKNWWKIINWKEVEIRLILAMEAQITLSI